MHIFAKLYRICDATASRTVRTTCIALRQALEPRYMPMPTTEQIAHDFEHVRNFRTLSVPLKESIFEWRIQQNVEVLNYKVSLA